MKKLWIYLAMPVALLNGCQRQQALLDEAGSLAMESPKDSGQQDGAAKDQEETGREQDGTVKDQEETWDESLPHPDSSSFARMPTYSMVSSLIRFAMCRFSFLVVKCLFVFLGI